MSPTGVVLFFNVFFVTYWIPANARYLQYRKIRNIDNHAYSMVSLDNVPDMRTSETLPGEDIRTIWSELSYISF